MRSILLLAVVGVLACGRSEGGGSSDAAAVMTVTVEDSGALPTCSEGNKNQLIYVTSEKQFQTCDGSAWRAVELPTTRIRASIHCSGGIPDIPGLDVYYDASRMTNDDIFITARISGASLSVSSSVYYAATQNGATKPGVSITYDVSGTDNAGWWSVGLDLNTLVLSATYNDVEITGGKQTWTMSASKCIVNNYE